MKHKKRSAQTQAKFALRVYFISPVEVVSFQVSVLRFSVYDGVQSLVQSVGVNQGLFVSLTLTLETRK